MMREGHRCSTVIGNNAMTPPCRLCVACQCRLGIARLRTSSIVAMETRQGQTEDVYIPTLRQKHLGGFSQGVARA